MKRRNRDRVSINILLLLTSSFILYSCSDITTPTDTENNQAQEQKATAQKNATSVEEFFQRNNRHYFQLAELVPGFGGIYLEKKGSVIVIRTTDLDELDKTSTQSNVKNYLAKETPNIGSGVEGGVQGMELRFEKASYEYVQLNDWHDQFLPLILNQNGVTFVSLSHTENKLRIGIEENHFETNVIDVLNASNLPQDAINISVTGKVQYENHTLRDYVRPLVGGLGWELETDNFFDTLGYGRCTIGFNAVQNGDNFWVTNSHCTEEYWSVDPVTDYYQHSSSAGSHIGNEAKDPYGITIIPFLCTSSRPCRFSDSALIEHASGYTFAFGEIAQTEYSSGPGQGAGSLVIDHPEPNFSIQFEANENHFFEGQYVHKMGQRTGWTYGQITDECVTFDGNFQGQNFRLFCQTYASYYSSPGDSGSPVFNRPYVNDDHVILYGIHWGRIGNTAIFSKIAGVEEDLGTLTVYY